MTTDRPTPQNVWNDMRRGRPRSPAGAPARQWRTEWPRSFGAAIAPRRWLPSRPLTWSMSLLG